MFSGHNLDGSQVSHGAAGGFLRVIGVGKMLDCPGKGQSHGLDEKPMPASHPTDAPREKKEKSRKSWPSFCFTVLGSGLKDVVWWSARKTANEKKKKKIPLI